MPLLLYCDGNLSKEIEKAIVSYLSYGWGEKIIPNPYSSYLDYIRYHLLDGTGLNIGDDIYEEKAAYQKIFKRC